jgi:hypothetical protein
MTIEEIFDLAIEIGINNDPRDKKEVIDLLSDVKKEYKDLSGKKIA